MKWLKSLVLSACFAALGGGMAQAAPLHVVASQAFYADLVRQVGGDRVEVKSIAPPKFNVHFIQPKPSDVRNVARANVVVYTGLDLEAWWGSLMEAAGRPDLFPGREHSIDLSRGIRLLKVPAGTTTRAEGDIHLYGNPHYILDPRNARIMAETIAERLKEIDSDGAAAYDANLKAFEDKLDRKIAEWKSECAHCAGKEFVAYHEEVEYLADFLGAKAEWFLEPKPGIPPTPQHLAKLKKHMLDAGVKAVVLPGYFPRGAAEAAAREAGGKVTTIALNAGEEAGTEDVFGFFDYNLKQMAEALR